MNNCMFEQPKAAQAERTLAKKQSRATNNHLVALAIVAAASIVLVGMWMVSNAKDESTRQMLQYMTMGTGAVAFLNVMKLVQGGQLHKAVETDTDTTVQIADRVQQDLTSTQEVAKKVQEVHDKVNGGLEERIAAIVVKTMASEKAKEVDKTQKAQLLG